MNSLFKRALVAVASSALLLSAPVVASTPAQASSGMQCRAHVQDATPAQYSYNRVSVTTGARAGIRTVAHYKTTNTTKSGRANSTGHGSTLYYISGSTPGYRVFVDVYVNNGGARSGHCRTSFVAH